jgi:Flp pilus assembly protein TadB
MPGELQVWAWPVLAAFIALPGAAAWRRRRVSREASAVAGELTAYAQTVRSAARCVPMDDALRARVVRLQVADAASLQVAQELERGGPEVLADSAQRLALRLRRRVAFERKMLARTAPGLRRAAVVASLPPLLMWAMQFIGAEMPPGAQGALLLAEAFGCGLLWRLAHVEI